VPKPADSLPDVTWDQVAALRLERQRLARPAPASSMLEIVRDHVAVQAQVMSSAELALHARTQGLTRAAVRRALWTDRTLVKTWAMRGTLHLVAAAELAELVAALGTRINHLRPIWLRYFGVTAEQMQSLQDAIGEILSERPMTRSALAAGLAAHHGEPALADMVSSGWGTFLKPAAGRGLLCFGPDAGRNVTFVRPSAWLGRPMPQPDRAAVAAVVARHLAAFPGATRGELARWWGVSAGELRPAIAALDGHLAEVRIEDTRAFVLADDVERLRNATPATGVRLLGGFDPYTLSVQKEAESLLPMARRPLVSRTGGWISAVLLRGGRISGTWTHEVSPKRVSITVSPWSRVSRAVEREIEREAGGITTFLAPGATPEVTIAAPA
jgi:uncharacterized protein YcaQ